MDCKATLKLPADWSGDLLSCYIAFASVQNNSVSNSVYVGDVKSDGSVEQGANGILYNDGVIDKTPSKDDEGNKDESGNKGDVSGGGSSTGDGGGTGNNPDDNTVEL